MQYAWVGVTGPEDVSLLVDKSLLLSKEIVTDSSNRFASSLIRQFIEQEGRLTDAGRLMGWCEKVLRSVGGIRDRMDQFIVEKADRKLRDKFGENDYSILLAEGSLLSNDEAIKLANSCLNGQ